jgi:AAA family ATP:ADP antiporter
MFGGFIPIFSLIRRVKMTENGTDYSLTNTTRQSLFLPLDRDAKYDGKMAIDTFFWRFGDLMQALTIYVGLNLLGWQAQQFAFLNLALSMVWMGLAVAIGRSYHRKALENLANTPPEAVEPIPDLHCTPGQPFRHQISPSAFHDADPGDVVTFRACCEDGGPLPRWLRFDAWRQTFTGTWPKNSRVAEIRIAVIASDMEGLKAQSAFSIRPSG